MSSGLEHALNRLPPEGASRERRRGHHSSPQLSQGCSRSDVRSTRRQADIRGISDPRLRYQRPSNTATTANGRRRGDSGATQRSRLASGPPRTPSQRCVQPSSRDTAGDGVNNCLECRVLHSSLAVRRRPNRPRPHCGVPPLDLSSLHLDSDEEQHSDKRKDPSGRRNRRHGLTTPLLRRP